MARARKAGDDTYNARRRYVRAAERKLKQAMKETGAIAERLKFQARENLEKAMKTYDEKTTQQMSKQMRDLAEQLGVDIQTGREQLKKVGETRPDLIEKSRQKIIDESTNVLEGAFATPEERRQAEARAIFRNETISSRILGGLVDVWRDEATVTDGLGRSKIDNSKILPALFSYFNVDNLADLLDKIQDIVGASLFTLGDSEEIYDTVKLLLQRATIDNSVTI